MRASQNSALLNRREFLKAFAIIVGSVATASVNSAFTPPPKTLGSGANPVAQYKGSPDGYIYESLDGGKTWKIAAYLGSQYAISKISRSNSWWVAQIVFGSETFALKSQNGRMWYSQNYKSPYGLDTR